MNHNTASLVAGIFDSGLLVLLAEENTGNVSTFTYTGLAYFDRLHHYTYYDFREFGSTFKDYYKYSNPSLFRKHFVENTVILSAGIVNEDQYILCKLPMKFEANNELRKAALNYLHNVEFNNHLYINKYLDGELALRNVVRESSLINQKIFVEMEDDYRLYPYNH